MELSDEELELFELAFHLRMPLYNLVEEMPYDEFLGWCAYFQRRPPEWRDDNRAALIMAASGAKIKPEQIFPSLKAMMRVKTDTKNLKNSAVFQFMLGAVGGDKLEFKDDNDVNDNKGPEE